MAVRVSWLLLDQMVPKVSRFTNLLEDIGRLADNTPSLIAFQQAVVQTLARELPRYNWVGFYMLDPEDASVLVLGPFYGEPTTHVRIPVTQGICGSAE